MTTAAVAAVAAAGGAVWGVRRGRAAAAAPPVTPPISLAPPELPAVSRPPAQPDEPRPATTPRRYAIVALALIATAVVVGVLATTLDRPANVDPTARIAPASSNVPAWPPTTTSTWAPPTTSPSSWAVPAISPTTTAPAPAPVGGVLPPNGSVVMRGDSGEDMTLTVTRVDNPAPARDPDNPSGPELPLRIGYRLVAIHVLVKNTGGVPFLTDIEKHTWLVDKAGHTYPRNNEMTDARQLHPASTLHPESWNGHVIVVEIKGNIEITRFRLSLHPDVAKQTQDWRLT
jgi:hypothetical protein